MKKSAIPDGHPKPSVRKQILVSGFVFLLLVTATILLILYGRGYRLFVQEGEPKVSKTGILNLNSTPPGAQVFIDDNLTTATNNSLNLTPGNYHVKIAKEGYHDWLKDFEIQREVVSNANATLFPKAPSLQSISTFGIQSAFIDPTGTKLAFNIASNSARRNGIYIFDMTSRNFPVLAGQSDATQIADDTVDLFSEAKIAWSPDGKQIMASISATPESSPTYYLLNIEDFNETPQNITATVTSTFDLWQQQREDKKIAQLRSLKADIQKFTKTNFHILSWSPDDSKILYQASTSAEMPVFRKPRFIGNNLLYERRELTEGSVYVYNIKEDINTRLIDP
ncbi:MAG: PEGA domain-containing protein, partial [Acidobacteriota bacterium]